MRANPLGAGRDKSTAQLLVLREPSQVARTGTRILWLRQQRGVAGSLRHASDRCRNNRQAGGEGFEQDLRQTLGPRDVQKGMRLAVGVAQPARQRLISAEFGGIGDA